MKHIKITSNKNIIRALIVLFVLSMLVVLSGLNKPHLNPFKTSVKADDIIIYNADYKDYNLLIDSDSKRILLLDSNQELIRIIDLTKSGSPIEKANDAIITDNKLYVIGTTSFNSGKYIASEKFIEFDLEGNVKKVITEKQYMENDYVTSYSFKDLSYSNKYLYITYANGSECNLYRYNTNNYKSKSVASFNVDGVIYSAQYIPESETIEVTTILQENYIYSVGSGYLSANPSHMPTLNVQGDTKTVKFSTWFTVKNILFWVCLTYFLIVIILGLYKLLINKIGNKGKLSIFIIILILLASIYYTNNSYKIIDNQYKERLRIQSIQLSDILSNQFDEFGIDEFDSVRHTLKNFCEANGTDLSVYARLYVNKDGKYYSYASSEDRFLTDVEIEDKTIKKLKSLKASGQTFINYSTKFDSNLSVVEYITNDAGDIIAFVEVCCSEYMLIKDHQDFAVNLFVNLVAIYIAIFVSISAFKALYSDGKLFRKLSKIKDPNKGFVLNSYYQFIFKLMTSMDLVIQVYVCQSLCTEYSGAKQAAMIAIPMSMFSAGMWLGTMITPICVNKLGNRTTSILGCLGSVLAYGLSILGVINGSIMIYSASKLLTGAFAQGVLFIVGDSIPFMIKNSEERNNAIVSAQQSTTAATIVATLAGGYIAQYLSYSTIYLVSGIFAVVLLGISILIFSKNSEESKTRTAKSDIAATWKVFLQPVMLVYILCFMMPKTLIAGYNSYLFPLYSSSAGVSAVLLSNLNAFSNTFSYLTNTPLNKFISRYDSTKSTVAIALIICSSFICFLLSPNIWWAIIVMFIYAALSTVIMKGNKVYIADRAEEYEMEPSKLRTNSLIIDDGVGILKAPVLSAFITLGYNYACAAVGAVCGLLFSIFGIYNKRRNEKQVDK